MFAYLDGQLCRELRRDSCRNAFTEGLERSPGGPFGVPAGRQLSPLLYLADELVVLHNLRYPGSRGLCATESLLAQAGAQARVLAPQCALDLVGGDLAGQLAAVGGQRRAYPGRLPGGHRDRHDPVRGVCNMGA